MTLTLLLVNVTPNFLFFKISGGYNSSNAARLWTYLTSLVCRKTLSEDIPDNDFFLKYSPDYEMKIEPKTIKDLNLQDDLNKNYRMIKGNFKILFISRMKINFYFFKQYFRKFIKT